MNGGSDERRARARSAAREGVVIQNTDFQHQCTTLELSQSLLCSPATSCHVEPATNLRSWIISRVLLQQAMLATLARVSLCSCAHTTQGTRHFANWLHACYVGCIRKVARATCLRPRAPPCPRACAAPSIIMASVSSHPPTPAEQADLIEIADIRTAQYSSGGCNNPILRDIPSAPRVDESWPHRREPFGRPVSWASQAKT